MRPWAVGAASEGLSAKPSGFLRVNRKATKRKAKPSPVRRHFSLLRLNARREVFTRALLRARRDGKPHQGVPARSFRRPHLGGNHARQSAALYFASMAYVLLCALRRIGLKHTQFAKATCGTIRLRLLKIGASVRTGVRRIKIAMASAFPHQKEFSRACNALAKAEC